MNPIAVTAIQAMVAPVVLFDYEVQRALSVGS